MIRWIGVALLAAAACVLVFQVVWGRHPEAEEGGVLAPSPDLAVRGTLHSAGSDTMNNLMAVWGGGFRKMFPAADLAHEGKGSNTAVEALIDGRAELGAMSREMRPEELAQFESRFGYPPTAIPVALDIVVVLVHEDNPLPSLTLAQIDAIFSKSRKGGHPTDIVRWGDLGLRDPWRTKPIRMYGRNSASGTYAWFKQRALFKGDFKDTVAELPGSSAVASAVASDPNGIGYVGLGYVAPGTCAVALSQGDGSLPHPPTRENVQEGSYPLGRFLWLCVNRRPGESLAPLPQAFLRLVLGPEGQGLVSKVDFFPLDRTRAERAAASVGITRP